MTITEDQRNELNAASKQHPPAYFNGMRIRFTPSNSNTGVSTRVCGDYKMYFIREGKFVSK